MFTPAAPSVFHLEPDAPVLGSFLEGFGGQIGVGQPGGTGCHRHKPPGFRPAAFFLPGPGFRVFLFGHEPAERLRRFGIHQAGTQFLVQHQGGQARQHLHMQIIGIGRCRK